MTTLTRKSPARAHKPFANYSEWPAWSTEFLNRLACICPLGHLHARIFLAHGDTAAEIIRLSERQSTDLIVLAWRGIWEAPHAAALKDILREAHCPIMWCA
jgi:hypothetical protein